MAKKKTPSRNIQGSTSRSRSQVKPSRSLKPPVGSSRQPKRQTSSKPRQSKAAPTRRGAKPTSVREWYKLFQQAEQGNASRQSKGAAKKPAKTGGLSAKEWYKLLKAAERADASKSKRVSRKGAKKQKPTVGGGKKKGAKKQTYKSKYEVPDVLLRANPESARLGTLDKERARLYQIRHKINQALKELRQAVIDGKKVPKSEFRRLHNALIRTTRALEEIKKRKDTYTEPEHFGEDIMYELEEGKVLIENVYKWEASARISDLLNSRKFKRFVIDNQPFDANDSPFILMAVDELETKADLEGQYYLVLVMDFKVKEVTLNLP